MMMKKVLAASAALLVGSAGLAWGQDVQWVETRFHRVHLRNGNFIDGKMEANTEKEVTLLIGPGEFSIRKDQVDRIELVKMRSLREKPRQVATSLAAPSRWKTSKPLPQIDAIVREKVDHNLAQFVNASAPLRDQLTRDLSHRPGTAAYLVSQLERVQDDALPYVGRAIWDLKEEDALPYVLDCLDSDRAGVVAQALILSSRWGGETALSHVRRFLSDSRPLVRMAAIDALKQAGDLSSLPEIAELLRSENDQVRATAINACLDLGRKYNRMETIAEAMRDALARARGKALGDLLEACGRSRHPALVDGLIEALRDGDVAIRQRAAAGLVLNGSPLAARVVAQRLTLEESVEVRIQLVRGAAAMKSIDAIDPLIYLLRDSDADLVHECARALNLITRQNYGDSYKKWSSWWELVRRH